MLEEILRFFPAHVHPLTLVHDPDGLLADEQVAAELRARGFRLLEEVDPVRLRHRVEQVGPFSAERPLLVVTREPLNQLPYDLWQQGIQATLALHTFFPNLAYPVVQSLSPAQRWQLALAPSPSRALGRQATMDHALHHVFGLEPARVQTASDLVAWLNRYHLQGDPMPTSLAEHLVARLSRVPVFAAWPLADLLASRDAFAAFLQRQWEGYIQMQTGQSLGEHVPEYLLGFDADGSLQDALPGLVRSGVLRPADMDNPDMVPGWARPGVVSNQEERIPRRIGELLTILKDRLAIPPGEARWPHWQSVARAWAELEVLRHEPAGRLDTVQQETRNDLEGRLDVSFLEWLRRYYPPLGSQRLPLPHHLFHVPDYLAYGRRQGRDDRVALLVMDGMALADWLLIGPAWEARHPAWRFEEQLLLAQVPTITAVSRQSLVSGRRPADFAATLHNNRSEAREWVAFWRSQDVPETGCGYDLLKSEGTDSSIPDSPAVRALCLVYPGIDDLLHGSTLGNAGILSSLRVWLDRQAHGIEAVIEELLRQEFSVHVTSDHGHVEARGIGQPSEGVLVQTRSKRARLYDNRKRAESAQQAFPDAILWGEDGLLPEGIWALMPAERGAFAPYGETIVSHGGTTIEEVVVPFVTITRS